jgi:hypothetical protein
MRHLLPVIIASLFVYSTTHAQTLTFGGYILDAASKEALPGATVFCGSTGTTSNVYGYFSVKAVPTDSIRIVLAGYLSQTIAAGDLQDKDGVVQILLEERSRLLSGVDVVARNEKQETGVDQLSKAQIRALPALMGEKDALKAIQLLPGVQRGNEGNSSLFVRGGTADQNLVLLDEAPVYNLNHFFGLFSVFNGDAIKDLNFYKGFIPAKFGGRLSSVLEMTMLDGNKERWKGEGGIGLLSSRIVLQGPLKKNRSSVLVAARRSYFDLLFSPFLRASNGIGLGYYFQDFNLKANYALNQKNYLIASAYFGKDRFRFSEPAGLEANSKRDYNRLYWKNATTTLRWNHIGRQARFSNTSLIFNRYQFGTDYEDFRGEADQKPLSVYSNSVSGITDLTFKHEWWLTLAGMEVRTGALVTQHLFVPANIRYRNDLTPIENFEQREEAKAAEGGVFWDQKLVFAKYWTLQAGIRGNWMRYDSTQSIFTEPRASLRWSKNKKLGLTLAYTRTNQMLQLLSNTGVSLPTDFWVPSTRAISPQQADQFSLGSNHKIGQRELSLGLEIYYKKMRNIAGFREGSAYIQVDNPNQVVPKIVPWRDILLQGTGDSYGLEVLLEKKQGLWTGWASYTWSKTTHQFDEINGGKPYHPFFDRRHTINLVNFYKPNPRMTFAVIWVFASPNPVALPIKSVPVQVDGDIEYVPYYGQRGQVRHRAYHRLDVSAQFHKKKRRFDRTWEFGVYNLYNQKNPFLYTLDEVKEPNGQTKLAVAAKSLFVFIPNVSYNFSF